MSENNRLSDAAFLRYQRQVSLTEVGEQGQLKLNKAHVLIIGCGGLGSAAAQYLAASGVGRLVIVDDDVVESSNLQRQTVYRESDLGRPKAESMREQLMSLNSSIRVRSICERLDEKRLGLEVMLADVVLDCSDNMPTRQLINLTCFQQTTDLVSGSAIGWKGQFAVFEYSNRATVNQGEPEHRRESKVACYRCLFPFDEVPNTAKCSESGIVGPVVGTIGNYQALATIQKLARGRYTLTPQTLHLFDGLSLQWQTLAIAPDPQCTVCGSPFTSSNSNQKQQTGELS
ncbi:HesA/MoeB/ThiF family protein [Vibrio maerlii]|uniref:HesA/MoeB/ThiF family protein n=1 Tax=Vibrio maerlii TaxID=2231648 RepID=UPI000E3D1F29|nr:HesA/MoeB/ThiF family protein [Vibrio maerlii]